ncbi:MAG: hypothetical protein ACYCX2_01725 [Christensenellales bacterium]
MEVDFEWIQAGIEKRAFAYIGTGSARTVYDLNNGTVVKAAKNKRGVAQNRAEYRISKADESNLLAKTLHISLDHRYLIMEKAGPVDGFHEVLDYFRVQSSRQLFSLDRFRSLRRNHALLLNDFRRPANWGVIGGRYVIVDYGFTDDVRRRYYRMF